MAWQKRKAGKMIWCVEVVGATAERGEAVVAKLEARLGKLVSKGAFVHTIDFSDFEHGFVRIVTCQREKPQPKKKAVKPEVAE